MHPTSKRIDEIIPLFSCSRLFVAFIIEPFAGMCNRTSSVRSQSGNLVGAESHLGEQAKMVFVG